jgi:CelD/BcsL family acetyltransferase involved in cellulose biosynthesis
MTFPLIDPRVATVPAPTLAARLTCTVIGEATELERLAPAWCDLLERSAQNSPFLAPVWLLPWWRAYGTGRALRVGLFQDGDRLVGLAPLCRRRVWVRRCLPFRRLEPLGVDVPEGDGVGSEYLGVIALGGAEEPVAHAFAQAVASGRFGPCDEVVLPVQAADGPMPELLTTALAQAGFRTESEQTGFASYIPLPPSWDEYLRTLSGNQRYYLRRSIRDFEGWAAGHSRVERVTSIAELAEGKRLLTSLHGERWAQTGQAGVFASPRFTAFHEGVLAELLQRGALWLWWLVVRGDPIAAIYNIVWDGKVLVYQAGRKPDLPREIRPGIILHAHAIRAAIEMGCREYDFLGGVARYKSQLAPGCRPLMSVRAVRPSLKEHARRILEAGIRWTRPLRASLKLPWPWPSEPRRGDSQEPGA